MSPCGSFRRAAPFVEHLQKYKISIIKVQKKKDQEIFSHIPCFYHTGITFEQY